MRSTICLSLLLALLAGAARAQSGAGGEADMERARKAYGEGATAYRLGNYAEAARKFEDSYRIMRFPTMLFNAAQSYRLLYEQGKNLDHLRRALELYRAFLKDAAPDAENRPAARKLIPDLEKTLAAESQRRREELLAKASGREGLRLAQQLYAEGAVRDAALALDRVLSSGHNPRDVMVAALEKRALVAGRLGQSEIAVEGFKRALALDPGFLLPEGTDAATASAFVRAREALQGQRPLAITHIPPGDAPASGSARIAVTVDSDPLDLVTALLVYYRPAGGGAYSQSRAGKAAGAVEIPAVFLSGLRSGARVEYYVAALDRLDNELATLGAPTEPFVLAVAPGPGEVGLGASAGASTGSPWYRRWWVWAIVGGVAAGGAAGAYLATRSGPLNPPSVGVPTQ